MKAREVERLIADLRGGEPVRRAAALARLRVIGSRAVAGLGALIRTDADAVVRADALSIIEGIDDRRVVAIALVALDDPDDAVRLAAVGVLRAWLGRESGTLVLEALAALALDQQHPAPLRLAALDALSDLPRDIVTPILEHAPQTAPAETSDDPLSAREWLSAHADAPLSELHHAVVRIRDRERTEPSAPRRHDWTAARGAVHAALARRGSRVALYDLRESFDAAPGPLPLDYLTAVTAIGDASCLEPLARAWAAAPAAETWWRDRLADAAADIMRRTRQSGRSAAIKRIRQKWPGFL